MKLLKLLFLSLSCLFATIQQAYGYTASEAFKIAKDSCGAQYDYYIGRTRRFVQVNNETQFLNYHVVLVDLMPKAGWNHPCKLVYVPNVTNDAYPIEIVDANCPPEGVNFNPLQVHKWCYAKRPSVPKIQSNVPDTAAAYASQHTYALIISGGVTTNLNQYRYWNDCSFIYQTLRNRFDIPKSHIKVAMSDGTNTAADMNYEGRYISSPLDLDEDGEADIEYSATKANIGSILGAFADSLTENDHLFIYVIDHGGLDAATNRSYISLWQFERLYSNELADMLSDVNAGFINVVMGQCHSGGFAKDLKANGRVITTACGKDELSYACEKIPFDEFVYRWTSAINGADAFGNTVNSDANSDGIVTMEEAFAYADANDIYAHGRHSIVQETPDTCSYTLSVVEDLAFNRIPELVDLYMRDYRSDTGAASMQNGIMAFPMNKWNTPDIWSRHEDDGLVNQKHQNVHFTEDDSDEYVYVRVHNRGTKPYPGYGKRVTVFWANSGIGLTYKDWRGIVEYGESPNGGRVGSVQIRDVINPGASSIVKIDFSPKNDDLLQLSENPNFSACFLAIVADHNIYNDIPIDENEVAKVWESNDMVQRNNVFIVNKDELDLYLSNNYRSDSCMLFIREDQVSNPCQTELSVSLPSSVVESWIENGKGGEYVVQDVNNSNRINITDTLATITNFRMSADNNTMMNFKCNFIANEDITEQIKKDIDLLLFDKVTGKFIGGETFSVICNPRPAINATIETEETNGNYQLHVSNVDESAIYEWYNSDGVLIGTGDNITVPSYVDETYTVKVVAENDAAIVYADVEVNKEDAIQDVFSRDNKIDVVLRHEADSNSTIVLSSISKAVKSSEYSLKEGEKTFSIPVSGIESGIYQVSLTKDGKVVDSKKVIKK